MTIADKVCYRIAAELWLKYSDFNIHTSDTVLPAAISAGFTTEAAIQEEIDSEIKLQREAWVGRHSTLINGEDIIANFDDAVKELREQGSTWTEYYRLLAEQALLEARELGLLEK